MPQNLNEKINDVLADRQLSISAITRELKEKGFVEHRLVLTGYLRALRDLKKLQELEVPPSKVYSRLDSPERATDIYSIIGDHLRNLDVEMRLPLAICIISKLFKRPVFQGRASESLESIVRMLLIAWESPTCMVTLSRGRKCENSIVVKSTKIEMPVNDPAYEIKTGIYKSGLP